jgi:hypothetical protein
MKKSDLSGRTTKVILPGLLIYVQHFKLKLWTLAALLAPAENRKEEAERIRKQRRQIKNLYSAAQNRQFELAKIR